MRERSPEVKKELSSAEKARNRSEGGERRRHDSGNSPPKRRDRKRDSSGSSSPSPARERLPEREAEARSKVRPSLVSTVKPARLYSNSPSPPPQLEAWKQKEKERGKAAEKPVEQNISPKPNNER